MQVCIPCMTLKLCYDGFLYTFFCGSFLSVEIQKRPINHLKPALKCFSPATDFYTNDSEAFIVSDSFIIVSA